MMLSLCSKCNTVYEGDKDCPMCSLQDKIGKTDDLVETAKRVLSAADALRAELDELESEVERAAEGKTVEEQVAEEDEAAEQIGGPEEPE